MKKASLVISIAFMAASLSLTAEGQQLSNDVSTILRASLNAQSGRTFIQDVTLNGSARYVEGSDDETVPFGFEATSSGSSRTEIELSEGKMTEIRQSGSSGPKGSWSKRNGESHSMSGHNMMVDAAWYFPLFVVERLLSDRNAVVFIAAEDGFIHIQSLAQQSPALSDAAGTQLQHLSQIDLYLDPKTFLPARFTYNLHPDNNLLIDIAVSVQYSSYRSQNGVMMPMHIEQYLNNCLALDVQVQNAAFNSGLSQSNFDAQ